MCVEVRLDLWVLTVVLRLIGLNLNFLLSLRKQLTWTNCPCDCSIVCKAPTGRLSNMKAVTEREGWLCLMAIRHREQSGRMM
jgi:hypothetical protein